MAKVLLLIRQVQAPVPTCTPVLVWRLSDRHPIANNLHHPDAITSIGIDHDPIMLTEIYISALLIDEKMADRVWEAWIRGEIDDQVACIAWVLIDKRLLYPRKRPLGW